MSGIQTLTLPEMISASRIDTCQDAIVSTLDALMIGVTVKPHPGKLDFQDVVAKSVVRAPGVGVGWSRIRGARDPEGTFETVIDWTAYIVAEDKADIPAKTRMSREAIAFAVGTHILKALHDDDVCHWGLTKVTRPAETPAPEIKPLFTAAAYGQGTVYYAVTWRQALIDEGAPFFGTETVTVTEGAMPSDVEVDVLPDVPPELRALYAEEDAG